MAIFKQIYACEECPTDCSTQSVPAVKFAPCANAVTDEESEITGIFVTVPEVDVSGNVTAKGGPADWTDAGSWSGAIDESAADKVRYLIGIGDKPDAEQNSRTISKGRTKQGIKTFTLNFDLDDITDENYTFMRTMECGLEICVWYESAGGYLYGGPNGILAEVVKADFPMDRGQDSYAKIVFNIQWKAKCNPLRIANPMAA